MEQLKLNMIPNGVNPVFHASQYDKGRQIRFALDETLSGAEVTVSYRAKDGTEYGNVQMSVSGNTITDTIPEEVLTDYGIIEGEVNIDGIGSLNFFVEVEKDAYDGGVITTQTATGAIATFETNIETAFVSLKADINPVQDLHGYSKPWSGGGGKNKLPLTVDGIKALNAGTWSGNSITLANVTFTILTDADGNVTGIRTNGTSTSAIVFNLTDTSNKTFDANYKINGVPSGLSGISLRLTHSGGQIIAGSGADETIPANTYANATFVIYVLSGTALSNVIITPMVRNSSASADYEPYSNICPISGFSALNVTRTGVNLGNFQNGYGIDASGNIVVQNNRASTVTPIIIKPSLSYYVKTVSNNRFIYAVFNDNTLIRRVANVMRGTLLDTTNGNKLYVCLYDNVTVETDKPMVVFDNAITTYEPYNGQTATVNFGQTVYGGVADVTGGTVTVNDIYLPVTGNYFSGIATTSGVIRAYTTPQFTDRIISACDCLDINGNSATVNSIFIAGGQICVTPAWGQSVTTIDEFKTLLASNPINIVISAATPIEITTTPENLTAISGENNVYGDTNGDTEVEYYIEV